MSPATAVVTAGPPINVSPPTISGTLVVGSVLSSTAGTWQNVDANTQYAYRWDACYAPQNGGVCTTTWAVTRWLNIDSASLNTRRVRLTVTVTNAVGSTSATSEFTGYITNSPALPYLQSNFAFSPDGDSIPSYALKPSPTDWLALAWQNGPVTNKSVTWYACDTPNGDLTGCLTLDWVDNGEAVSFPVRLVNPANGKTIDTYFGVCDYYRYYTTWHGLNAVHDVDYSNRYIVARLSATNAAGTGYSLGGSFQHVPRPGMHGLPGSCPHSDELVDQQLLTKFRPDLRYDALEGYYAISAAAFADNHVAGSHTNRLIKDGAVIASSDPAAEGETLSLGFLGPSYTNGATSNPADYIDAADSYASDGQRLYGDSNYTGRIYGRAIRETSGALWLQYWVFYYYNPKTFFTVGEHEGDWEMIQLYLDSGGKPLAATYSQHNSRETCAWDDVEKASIRPVVYVAEGSHANYFTAGTHSVEIWDSGIFVGNINDTARGNAPPQPGPYPQIINSAMSWMFWTGRWGQVGGGPRTPSQQGERWGSPTLWALDDDAYACRAAQPQGRLAEIGTLALEAVPPAPRIRAHRSGRNVVIRYSFATLPVSRSRRPWQLITSVDATGTRYPPLTIRTPVRRRTGTVTQPLGLGRAPYVVRVAALARDGSRSRVVQLRLE